MAKKTTWTEDIKGFLGLEYVTVLNVPMKQTAHGPVINMDLADIEKAIFKELLKQGAPIRGKEVKAFRKYLGLSLERLAAPLDLVSSTVQRWEATPTERLSSANEVLIKVFMAEQLGIELPARLSVLRTSGFSGDLTLRAS